MDFYLGDPAKNSDRQLILKNSTAASDTDHDEIQILQSWIFIEAKNERNICSVYVYTIADAVCEGYHESDDDDGVRFS